MSALKSLSVKHTATYKGDPLVVFDNLPGQGAELTPAALRALAAAFLVIADDCEAHRRSTRRYADIRRDYEVGV